ncbi:hypothetical protein AX17_004641 [Amanita inopinata Kibby_2008]|nr:hypothetical protein AX17_004641 [Amanita inopinata Kibby_2008]
MASTSFGIAVIARLFLVFLTAGTAFGVTYLQTEDHRGTGFLQSFSYEAIRDPSHGRVNYVDATTAANKNLTYASGNHFVLRADSTTVLNRNGPGRDSVRLMSNRQYTNGVMIFSLRHIPTGCGTWPAIWTIGPNWPNHGEIDIMEGVNGVGPNQVTLHTSRGCTMPEGRPEKSTEIGNNCDATVNNNVGCGVKLTDAGSFGSTFNQNGGGWYALERTNSFIKVWFWSRASANVPSDVSRGDTSVDTDSWGVASAYFPDNSCPISRKFGPQNIAIDLTFCGDWAGNAYSESGCPSTCVDFVNNNPSAFREAYFDFEWLKIYG